MLLMLVLRGSTTVWVAKWHVPTHNEMLPSQCRAGLDGGCCSEVLADLRNDAVDPTYPTPAQRMHQNAIADFDIEGPITLLCWGYSPNVVTVWSRV